MQITLSIQIVFFGKSKTLLNYNQMVGISCGQNIQTMHPFSSTAITAAKNRTAIVPEWMCAIKDAQIRPK